MAAHLSLDEQRYVEDLLAWDTRRRPAESILTQAALVAGGLLIAGAAVVTFLDLRDATVMAVLVPGFLGGLFLMAMHVVGRARVEDRHRIASIARKLTRGM